MRSTLTLSEALELLAPGVRDHEHAKLLLPTARAAREMRSAFDAQQRALGHRAWEPASALSWQQWIKSQWSDLIVAGAESRLLLNAAQEHSLWREIIRDDAGHRTLGSADALAELAHSAWQLAAAHNAIGRLRGAGSNYDSKIFCDWATEFSKRSNDGGYLPAALLEDALQTHIARGALAVRAKLRLAGFGELSPAQESLLSALRERGCEVERYELEASNVGETVRASVIAATPRAELELAARWIRNFLEEHRDTHPRIALLVPSLSEERAEIDSVLREVLAPELQDVRADLSSAPWETSRGEPLASLEMISTALEVLQWTQRPLSIERAGAVLRSPYLGDRSQRDALARFDARTLRRLKRLRPEIELAEILRLLSSKDSTLAPWLRDVQALAQRSQPAKPRTFAEWMEHVRALLAAAQWPGSDARGLNATEFEAMRAWDSVLDLVSTLDFGGARVDFATALSTLDLQAQRTLFSPPATHAPVQVMSVTEAEGCLLDAIVFLRATDANWPAPEHTHPLLPWPLQRSLAMPGTDAARTSERARAFTASLLRCSGTVLFTSAAEDDDGQLRPSPLLAGFGLEQLSPEQLCPTATPSSRIQPEIIADDTPLPPLPSREVRGGSAVLKSQAACGFRAFAEFRLGSRELETTDLGFDAPESGSRLHSALQLFWKQVETQDALRAMSTEEREELLRKCVDQAMARTVSANGTWDEAYLQLQKQRMCSLLMQWLDAELQRSPFRVQESETKLKVDVGPLTLDVRFDRIDKLEDGFALVDYKTGASGHPNQWEGERPDDPQLPLYALLDGEDELKALAFAKVRTGEMKWLGVQAAPGILPPSRVNDRLPLSPALIDEWRRILTQLAYDFADGRSGVDPYRYPQTCDHCGQRILCRLNPATLSRAGHEDEEYGEGGANDE